MTPAGSAGTASGQYRAEPPHVEGTDGLREKLSEALGQLAMRGGYGLGVLASERLAEDLLPVVREIAAEEVAPLLARLRAVEELADEYERRGQINADPASLDSRVHQMAAHRLRRALDAS